MKKTETDTENTPKLNRYQLKAMKQERGAGGQFKSKAEKWVGNNAEAFWQWCKDVEPRVLGRNRKYKVFDPTPKQKKAIEAILNANKAGFFKHAISLLVWPRRHGKSTIMALICLFFLTSRDNYTVQLLGNTEGHSRKVQYKTLVKIIMNTPALKKMIPEDQIQKFEISHKKRNSVIQMMSGNNVAAAFGDRIDLLWVSDFHACLDLEPYNALQASLLDSEGSMLLIDSNVDPVDGHVHAIQKEAKGDPSIYASHIQYRDIRHYCKAAPSWIDRAKARRLERTTLPADFKRDILGQRSDAQNSLFPSDVIEVCKSKYHTPVADLEAIARGRSYKIGGGLDRSKSLLGSIAGKDNTIWTTIMKVASHEGGEPEIHVLNQVNVVPNTSKNIKATILKDHQRYGFDNVVLENYEVTDLKGWLDDQRIENELISPQATQQNASFPEFHRIAKEGRLHFPEDMKDLASEMQTFTYTQGRGNTYSFGHSKRKYKDDRVYSLNWAIFSLRAAVMNLYTLGNIQCDNRSQNRAMCFLMGGGLQLACAEHCPAFHEVREQFIQFKQAQLDSELDIPEFFNSYVRVTGAVIYQAA